MQSQRTVADGQWHDVAVTWNRQTADVNLYLDGRQDGTGNLRPRGGEEEHIVRIGFAAPDFPQPDSFFVGQIAELSFHSRTLTAEELASSSTSAAPPGAVARWQPRGSNRVVTDVTGNGHDGAVSTSAASSHQQGLLAAGTIPRLGHSQWQSADDALRLVLPKGPEPLDFVLFTCRPSQLSDVPGVCDVLLTYHTAVDLESRIHGGPPRWTERLTTEVQIGGDEGPFAVDVLTHPEGNPWLAQMRLTGFDFFPDGDRAAVCAWDGDVWEVRGLRTACQQGRGGPAARCATPIKLAAHRDGALSAAGSANRPGKNPRDLPRSAGHPP